MANHKTHGNRHETYDMQRHVSAKFDKTVDNGLDFTDGDHSGATLTRGGSDESVGQTPRIGGPKRGGRVIKA